MSNFGRFFFYTVHIRPFFISLICSPSKTTSPESPTNKYRPQMPNHTNTMLFFDIIITYFPHSKITRKKFHSKLPHLTILHPVYVHLHHARQTDNHRATLTWYLYLLTCNKLTLLLVL